MVACTTFTQLALSMPDAVEEPHFEKRSFRIKKKIFATLDEKNKRAVLKFSAIDQSVFCSMAPQAIYQVENSWGKQGWTMVDLQLVDEEVMKDAIAVAYSTVLGKR
ncbi:MAG: MmcQ/YjbR family DNA-binding protein [Saprospiraceae bacterium]